LGKRLEKGSTRKEGRVGLRSVEEGRREGDASVNATDCLAESTQVHDVTFGALCLLFDKLFSASDPNILAIERELSLDVA
jgi:hypothetical protein